MKQLFLGLLLLLSVHSLAQDFSLSGQIIDGETGENLAFASVVIYENDSIFKSGTTTNHSGEFVVSNLKKTRYKIQISFVGYKTIEIEKLLDSDTNLGKITLHADAILLEDVAVTMTLPIIEHKADKIVVNVANSVTAESNKAIDMLRNSPGVTIDSEGNVQLNGKTVSIWIDGRPAYLSGKDLENYLNSIEASSLDKIELITNPSAKYDAEGGGGIIDLKLKKSHKANFSGSATLSHKGFIYDKKYYQSTSVSANLNYRSKISNTFISFSPYFTNNFNYMKGEYHTDTEVSNWRQSSSSFSRDNYSGHNLRTGTDFFIDKKNTIGFVINARFSSSLGKQNPQQTFNKTFINDTIKESSNSLIISPDNSTNISANLNYTTIFNEEKSSELTINLDYLHWTSKDSSYNDNRYFSYSLSPARPPQIFTQDMQQAIDVYSFKADFQHTFIKKLLFESGLKASVSRTNNRFLHRKLDEEIWEEDKNLSSDFRYTEQIYAMYASLSAQLGKKWNLKGGIRGEYTYNIGDWLSKNKKSYSNYFDVFPTVYASYLLSEKYNFSLSYSIRINRPSYYFLKPFKSYIDENTAIAGNPELKPMKTHNLSFSTSLINYFNIGVNYSHTNNLITQIIESDEKEKVFFRKNFGTKDNIFLNLSCSEYPLVKNRLTLTLHANLGYTENTDIFGYKNNSFVSMYYGNLTLILPKDWKVEASGWGHTGGSDGYFKVKGMGALSFGIRKSFLDNKLRLSFKFDDILNTYNSRVIYQQNGLKYQNDSRWSTPSFGISVSYNFGKATQTPRRKVEEIEESTRLSNGESSGINEK